MDAKQFLAEFGHIANANDGVQRLRKVVYNLAITGNFTERIGDEGLATELLESITKEKQQRIVAKQFKSSPKFERLVKSIPTSINIPNHWVWTNLVSIGEISPKNEANDELDASFIPMRAVSHLHSGKLLTETRKWGNIKKGYTQFADGDVAIAKITPCFENGKSAVIEGLKNSIGAGTTELHVVRPLPGVNPRYIYVFLRSPYFMVEGELKMTGTAGQKRLTSEYFASRPFPLPPLAEQARIAEKVDELMGLCDKLEAQQQKKRQLQNQLRNAILQTVSKATNPVELKQHWQRLQDYFEQLFSAPEDLQELRDLVLNLAFQGLITEEVDTDEPSICIVNRLVSKKRELIEEGVIKRKKASSTDIREEEYFTPPHWEKAPIDGIFRFIDYRGKTPTKTTSGISLVTAKNIRPGSIEIEPAEFISEDSYVSWMTRGFPKKGDLLFTTEAPLGNVARIEMEPSFALAQRVINLQPYDEINTRCTMFFMMSPIFQKQLDINATGMTAKGIKAAKLKQIKLPIPPKEEQERILLIVNSLMEVCDELSNKLGLKNRVAEQLTTSAIAALTGTNTLLEEESLKTPITELVAPVTLGENKPTNKELAPITTLLVRQNGKMNAIDLWQRFGSEIDAFYAQLKAEISHGWIAEPTNAVMLEKDPE
jgi:type I restriction enzyme S subunit